MSCTHKWVQVPRRAVGARWSELPEICAVCYSERWIEIPSRGPKCLWCVVAGMVHELGLGRFEGACPKCGRYWSMPVELGPLHKVESPHQAGSRLAATRRRRRS